jgi:hypothetical protein
MEKMNNAWLIPYNHVNFAGLVDVTANAIKWISVGEDGQEHIYHILDVSLQCSHIPTVVDARYPNGADLSYTLEEWEGEINDDKVPGLQSLIDFLIPIAEE